MYIYEKLDYKKQDNLKLNTRITILYFNNYKNVSRIKNYLFSNRKFTHLKTTCDVLLEYFFRKHFFSSVAKSQFISKILICLIRLSNIF